MKTLFTSALLTACAALGFAHPLLAAQPETGQPVNIDKVASHTYVVRISNPVQGLATVKLVNLRSGAILHKGSSKLPTYGEKLNLSQLPEGPYAFVVTMNNNTRRFPIDLQANQPQRVTLSVAGR